MPWKSVYTLVYHTRLEGYYIILEINIELTNIWKQADTHLVFVEFTVFVLFLSLLLKRDNDKTYKDIHHEEGDDDDVDDEEDGDLHSVVVDGPQVLPVWVNGLVQQPGDKSDRRSERE